jgi:hypothetical protein
VPNLHTVFKLCVALNINPAVLFDEPDEAKENAKQQILALVQHYL